MRSKFQKSKQATEMCILIPRITMQLCIFWYCNLSEYHGITHGKLNKILSWISADILKNAEENDTEHVNLG